MSHKKHFEELVKKIYDGKANIREVRELFRKLRSEKDIDESVIPDSLEENDETGNQVYDGNFEKVWSKVEDQINTDTKRKSGLRLPVVLRVAASIVILIIGGFTAGKVYQALSWTTYETQYGQIRTIGLDDGSTVVLNGNSMLKVHKNLSANKARDVYLTGEANFQVAKAQTVDARFVVHTKDLDVEVLGTRFNVNSRDRETAVYLEEGSVKIKRDELVNRDILMSPGEKIEYSVAEKELKRSRVESEINEISWRKGIFEFEELPLDKILRQITEPYNYTYQIENRELLDRRFTLRIPNNDLEFAISVLEKLTGTSITDNDGKLLVRELEKAPIE